MPSTRVKWCNHPTKHVHCTKIGQKLSHPIGRVVISSELASYMSRQYMDQIDDNFSFIGKVLCKPCFTHETMEQLNATDDPMTTSISSDDNSSESAMSEDDVQGQYSLESSRDLLNQMFALIGFPKIRDIRHRHALRKKVDDALAIFRRATDNILSQITPDSDNDDLTFEETTTLIHRMKLLCYVSEYDEQTRLLTLAPDHWGRKKIANFFCCTDHQASKAIELKANHGMLARPIDFRGNVAVSRDAIDNILSFYQSDEITRQSSNKKEVIHVNKQPVPFRFMLMSVGEAYEQYTHEIELTNKPELQVGRSTFYSLRPPWVKVNTPQDVCTCVYHDNFEFLFTAWNKSGNGAYDLKRLINEVLCNPPMEACFYRECALCAKGDPSDVLNTKFTSSVGDDPATWMTWKKSNNKENNNRIELQRISSTIAGLVDEFDNQWETILKHHFYTTQQMSYVKHIKEDSNENDTVIAQIDFAENFELLTQHAVQSTHWGQRQATLFTIHIKAGMMHYNLALISDYMHHDSQFVYVAQKLIVEFIRKKCPNVKRLVYLSDGGPAHFKNNYTMLNLTHHLADYKIPAFWTFFSTAHGKGPADGIGAALKSKATRYLMRGSAQRAFLSAKEFADWCSNNADPKRPVEVMFVQSTTVETVYKQILVKRWAQLSKRTWINGIREFHEFHPCGIGKMECRKTSTSKTSKMFQIR
jgi:hypothetical protein